MSIAWQWGSSSFGHPMLGPRDWSPKLTRAIENLKAKEALVPKEMILTKEEAAAAPPQIRDAVLTGTAFVVKVHDAHEVVYVSTNGFLIMSGYLVAIFDGFWGTVEEGLAAKVWRDPNGIPDLLK